MIVKLITIYKDSKSTPICSMLLFVVEHFPNTLDMDSLMTLMQVSKKVHAALAAFRIKPATLAYMRWSLRAHKTTQSGRLLMYRYLTGRAHLYKCHTRVTPSSLCFRAGSWCICVQGIMWASRAVSIQAPGRVRVHFENKSTTTVAELSNMELTAGAIVCDFVCTDLRTGVVVSNRVKIDRDSPHNMRRVY